MLFQPGLTVIPNSHARTEWTDTASGMMTTATTVMFRSRMFFSPGVPRQPSESRSYSSFRRRPAAGPRWSRQNAMSGMSGRNRKITVATM